MAGRAADHRALRRPAGALAAVERAGDRPASLRLAAEAVARADALVEVYRGVAPERALARRLVDRTVDRFLGRGHGIEEGLGALGLGGHAR